jgi:hypothetical protein
MIAQLEFEELDAGSPASPPLLSPLQEPGEEEEEEGGTSEGGTSEGASPRGWAAGGTGQNEGEARSRALGHGGAAGG